MNPIKNIFSRYNTPVIISASIISLITFLIYIPALQNSFVNWDDTVYVYENNNIRSIDFKFLKWIFTTEANPTWHPLTLLSFGIDYTIWGLNPVGYHITNIIFHVTNTALVFLLVFRLIEHYNAIHLTHKRKNESPKHCQDIKGNLAVAFIAAALFGIHPLNVESVAWISERKGVLCTFFYLSTLLVYLRYLVAEKKRRIYYGFSLILFILALFSKPMAVSLPAVLLILDFYLFKLPTKGQQEKRDKIKDIKWILLEKTPFFILSLILSFITLLTQSKGDALPPLELYPLKIRIFNAFQSYTYYLIKTALPFNLAPFYPHPAQLNFLSLKSLGFVILPALITLFSVLIFKRKKIFLSVWLYYVITLIPAIGIVKVGIHSMADRYTYLPSIGPFLLVGVGTVVLWRSLNHIYRVACIAIMTLIITVFMYRTGKQIGVWHDGLTLWSHEIKLFPTVDIAFYNRGIAYQKEGDHVLAIKDFDKVIELTPDFNGANNNRGNSYIELGDIQQAIEDFKMALVLKPNDARAYNNLGNAYAMLGNYREAARNYGSAVGINPLSADSYYNLGHAYGNLGEYKPAIENYDIAIKLNPQDADAYYNRGNAYFSLRNYEEAIKDYNKTIELNPQSIEGYYNLGSSYLMLGYEDQALPYYKTSARAGFKEAQEYLKKRNIEW